MKKIISLILSAVFILTALVACDKNEKPKETETKRPTETTYKTDVYYDPVSAVPSTLRFDGIELKILLRDNERYTREWYKKYAPETELEEAINERNSIVFEELNVKACYEVCKNNGEWEEWIIPFNEAVLSQNGCDIYAHGAREASSLEIRGIQANMLDQELFPYLSFKWGCWDKSLVEQAVNKKLYYIAGDINLSMYDQMVVMWYNQTLYDSYRADYDPADLQEFADEGNFTYEILYKWSELCEKKDNEDIYGISDLNYAFYDAVPYAWGLELITKDKKGMHVLNVVNNQSAEKAIVDLRNLNLQKGVHNSQASFDDRDTTASIDAFANGKIMFMPNTFDLGNDNLAIREMSDRYGLLQMPKYSLEQKKYATSVVMDFNLISIVNKTKDKEKCAAISAFLQKSAEISNIMLVNVYVESFLEPVDYVWEEDAKWVQTNYNVFFNASRSLTFDTVNLYGSALHDISWDMGNMVERRTDTLYERFAVGSDTQYTPEERLEILHWQLYDFDAYMFDLPLPEPDPFPPNLPE